MLKQKINSRRGFTIIEVVLVLAIAGLIFLMVFLALPALQRSQRDTQRRSDFSEFLTQVSNYQSNNRGRLPGTKQDWENFIATYLRPADNGCYRSQTSTKYTNNSNGSGSACTPTTFLDPIGEPYYIESVTEKADVAAKGKQALNWNTDKYKIYVYMNATCDGENAVLSDGGRNVAIRTKLEGGGTYCGHN